jgi:hypothetical protein
MCQKVTGMTESQIEALPALVAHACVSEGCKEAGISRKTYYEWLDRHPAFREELKARRRAIAEAALSGLMSRVEKAIDTLDALLCSDSDAVRRSAARDLLDLTFRLREADDIQARVERLEEMLEVRHA